MVLWGAFCHRGFGLQLLFHKIILVYLFLSWKLIFEVFKFNILTLFWIAPLTFGTPCCGRVFSVIFLAIASTSAILLHFTMSAIDWKRIGKVWGKKSTKKWFMTPISLIWQFLLILNNLPNLSKVSVIYNTTSRIHPKHQMVFTKSVSHRHSKMEGHNNINYLCR